MGRGDSRPAGDAYHLRDYINPPVNQDKIMAFMEQEKRPLRLSEIAVGTGLKLHQCARSMPRLHTQGRVTRQKLPMTARQVSKRGLETYPSRKMWVYSLPEQGE